VKTQLAAQGHGARRAKVKLLQSAAQLWKEPAAKLDLSPLLRDVLKVKKSELGGLAQLSQLDHGFVNFSRSTLAICSETRGFFPARSL
jgi:hypothetical protein